MKNLAILLAVVLTAPLLAAVRPVETTWSGSPEAFANYTVIVTTRSGARLEGQWISVATDSGRMSVRKTSRKREYPKGYATINRNTIDKVELVRHRIRGRVWGTIIGAYAGVALVWAATQSGEGTQGPAGFVPIATGVLGYYAGKGYDRAPIPVSFLPG